MQVKVYAIQKKNKLIKKARMPRWGGVGVVDRPQNIFLPTPLFIGRCYKPIYMIYFGNITSG